MSSRAQSRDLTPTQQSNLDLVTNSINVASVDVRVVTSWKDGLFDFEKMPLKEIMKVLSRWYDMEVGFNKEDIEPVILTGIFKKSQSIEEIMSALQSTNYINSYEIHDKTIILK
jgi:ferric-dicitrate binding protein FerR (iron transport regulator)